MTARQIDSLPIYPEGRPSKTPTAAKTLALFALQRRHRLHDGGRLIKTFWDPISDAQRIVLQLLDVSLEQFGTEN
jgi:hypothetical protein